MKRIDVLGARLLAGSGHPTRRPHETQAALRVTEAVRPWQRTTGGLTKLLRATRHILAAVFCAGVTLASSPATALTSSEAASVVDLIEALQPQLGPFACDEEIVAEWFERDAEGSRLITTAGFTAESWKAAVGETMRGFLAVVSEAELHGVFGDLKTGIRRLSQLNDVQKEEAIASLDEEFDKMLAMRAEGEPFVDVVRPLEGRLREVVLTRTE